MSSVDMKKNDKVDPNKMKNYIISALFTLSVISGLLAFASLIMMIGMIGVSKKVKGKIIEIKSGIFGKKYIVEKTSENVSFGLNQTKQEISIPFWLSKKVGDEIDYYYWLYGSEYTFSYYNGAVVKLFWMVFYIVLCILFAILGAFLVKKWKLKI